VYKFAVMARAALPLRLCVFVVRSEKQFFSGNILNFGPYYTDKENPHEP
jgi:hypothetical protein